MPGKRTILITGCSDGGLGSHLAFAYHDAGWRVIASARNLSKLKNATAKGIESVQLDVTSPESLKNAVAQVSELTGGSLDALLNNAGTTVACPLLDMDIQAMRNLFELNVFAVIATIQAFAPLLLKSTANPMIINQTSLASIVPVMWQATYNASKAALSSLTATLRLELEPFGIQVVELKTGGVATNVWDHVGPESGKIREGSVYYPAKDILEKVMDGREVMKGAWKGEDYAKATVSALSGLRSVPKEVWKGAAATMIGFVRLLPAAVTRSLVRDMCKSAEVTKRIKEHNGDVKNKTV